jgi:hypothetical protein
MTSKKSDPWVGTDKFEFCPECFLVIAHMNEHRFIEHGVEISQDEVDRIKARQHDDELRSKNRK